MAHEQLYSEDSLTDIDVFGYVDSLVRTIFARHRAAEREIRFRTEIDAGTVLIDIAVPMGLLLNELVSNSLVHGFPESSDAGTDGEREIRLAIRRSEDGRICIEYSDTGRGVPEGFDFRSVTTMGIRSITMLVEHQLQGVVRFSSPSGVRCEITFDDTIYEARV